MGLVEVYCWAWWEVLQYLWAWLKIYLWACCEGLSMAIVGKPICGTNGNIRGLGGGLFVGIFCESLSVGLLLEIPTFDLVCRPICGPDRKAYQEAGWRGPSVGLV